MPTPRLTFPTNARRHRRSPRVHPALRSLAGQSARAGRRRHRTRDIALSVRLGRASGGIQGSGVVLPDLLSNGVVAPAARGQGARAPVRDGPARGSEAGCHACAVVGSSRGGPLALPPAQPRRLHRARHRPPANRLEDRALETRLRTLRTDRRALATRTRCACRVRRGRGEATPDPTSGVSFRRRSRGRRSHRTCIGAHPSLQGHRGRRGGGLGRGGSSPARRRRPSSAPRGSAADSR